MVAKTAMRLVALTAAQTDVQMVEWTADCWVAWLALCLAEHWAVQLVDWKAVLMAAVKGEQTVE